MKNSSEKTGDQHALECLVRSRSSEEFLASPIATVIAHQALQCKVVLRGIDHVY